LILRAACVEAVLDSLPLTALSAKDGALNLTNHALGVLMFLSKSTEPILVVTCQRRKLRLISLM